MAILSLALSSTGQAETASFMGLGQLPGSGPSASTRAFGLSVSADGSTVAGTASDGSWTQAFVWTSAGGMESIGGLSEPGGDGLTESYGTDISADGSTVVGFTTFDTGYFYTERAFAWTNGGGFLDLGYLHDLGGAYESRAMDVSADGAIVVGYSANEFTMEAFIWTSGGGMVGLG